MPDVTRGARLVVGVGTRSGADAGELSALVDGLLQVVQGAVPGGPTGAPGVTATVRAVVTAARKQDEPAVVDLARRLGVALETYDDAVLADQPVAAPSQTVRRHVGVPSVAEAAVLAAGAVVVARTRSASATVVLGRLP